MSGYCYDQTMSVRAVRAYNRGEKPLSKISARDLPKGMSKKFFLFLIAEGAINESSWHHTSKMFNKTDFYCPENIQEQFDELIERGDLPKLLAKFEAAKKQKPVANKLVSGWYDEWSGSRRYGNYTRYSFSAAILKPNGWIYLKNGQRKNSNGNHIRYDVIGCCL